MLAELPVPELPLPLLPELDDPLDEVELAGEELAEAGDEPLLEAPVELLPEPAGVGVPGVPGSDALELVSGAAAARCKRSAFSSALSEILPHAWRNSPRVSSSTERTSLIKLVRRS